MRLRGWPLVGWTALLVGAMVGAILVFAGTGEAGLRLAVRATARTSLLLFSLAFTASSLHRLRPSRASRWLLDQRRYLGVSFAVSHLYHAAAIALLAAALGPAFEADVATLALGGFAYVVLAAMTATSFDTTARWLGPRRWRALHAFGIWYLWLIFALTLLPAAGSSPLDAALAAVPFLCVGLRIGASRWVPRGAARPA